MFTLFNPVMRFLGINLKEIIRNSPKDKHIKISTAKGSVGGKGSIVK